MGKAFSSPGTGKSKGVSILINKAINFNEREVLTDSDGRYVIVQGQLLDTPVALCNIYAPNSDNPEFFQNLSPITTLNTESKSAADISQLTTDLGLKDIWRLMHPDKRDYLFFSLLPIMFIQESIIF